MPHASSSGRRWRGSRPKTWPASPTSSTSGCQVSRSASQGGAAASRLRMLRMLPSPCARGREEFVLYAAVQAGELRILLFPPLHRCHPAASATVGRRQACRSRAACPLASHAVCLPFAVRKRNKGGGISFGRKRRRAVRKDREPDEDDAAFALTRFVPMLQEVLEDAGGWPQGRAEYGAGPPAGKHARRALRWELGQMLQLPTPVCCLLSKFLLPASRRPPPTPTPPPNPLHWPPAAAGRLSTDEYPYVATPASPSGSRNSLPSSADTTPKAGVGVSVRSVRTTGAWAKKGGAGGTPDKADAGRVSGRRVPGRLGRQAGRIA